jgi:hypothetical protein
LCAAYPSTSPSSFGGLAFLKLPNLTALTLNFALLVLDRALLLPRNVFLVLQRAAYDVSRASAEGTTNSCTSCRVTDGGPDYGTCTCPEYSAAYCALAGCRQ